MAMAHRSILGGLFAAAVLASGGTAAKAELLSACAPEVGRYCSDVSQGRGRVMACLAGQIDKLGPACLPELRSATGSLLVPGRVRKIFDPGFRAEVPASCAPAVARYCQGVAPGDGRVFACLYARTDRVGDVCSAEAEAAVERAN
jgi:hypothetical protein